MIEKRKEWFIIGNHGNETPEKMEHAFRNKHGIGMDEYENDPKKIVEVEKRREQDYAKEQEIVSRLERQVHRDI